jgi:hypothetical protein
MCAMNGLRPAYKLCCAHVWLLQREDRAAPDHTIEPLKNFLHERGHPHIGIPNRVKLTASRFSGEDLTSFSPNPGDRGAGVQWEKYRRHRGRHDFPYRHE